MWKNYWPDPLTVSVYNLINEHIRIVSQYRYYVYYFRSHCSDTNANAFPKKAMRTPAKCQFLMGRMHHAISIRE